MNLIKSYFKLVKEMSVDVFSKSIPWKQKRVHLFFLLFYSIIVPVACFIIIGGVGFIGLHVYNYCVYSHLHEPRQVMIEVQFKNHKDTGYITTVEMPIILKQGDKYCYKNFSAQCINTTDFSNFKVALDSSRFVKYYLRHGEHPGRYNNNYPECTEGYFNINQQSDSLFTFVIVKEFKILHDPLE